MTLSPPGEPRDPDRTFEDLPAGPDRGRERRLRICVASVDVQGPRQVSESGAAARDLSLTLAEAGHDVTLLYLHHAFDQGGPDAWRQTFGRRGITFVHHPQPAPKVVWYDPAKEASLRCYQWLARQQPFDVVHFQETLGLPYYPLLAKRQGLAFAGTTLCVSAHGPLRRRRLAEETLPWRAEDLVVDFMERRSVELADVAVSPSRDLLESLAGDGWALPRQTYLRRKGWRRWHQGLARCSGNPRPEVRGEPPLISICLAHHERPRLLAQMIRSIRVQDYPHFEVIVADDGSRSPDAIAFLEALERDFAASRWIVLRQQNRGPGAARHRAAERARGSHLLFVDDDDVLAPDALETFARVADHTGADALTCVYVQFEGDGKPDADTEIRRWFIPLGPALLPSLTFPEVGGTVYLLKRQTYFELGGFVADREVAEDWDLLLRVVAGGYDLQVIPEPLLWYRKQAESKSRLENSFQHLRQRIELYEKLLPPDLRDLASLAFGQLTGIRDADTHRRQERVREILDRARGLRP